MRGSLDHADNHQPVTDRLGRAGPGRSDHAPGRFHSAALEKARQFYTGVLGLEEAFDLKDSSGAIQSVFFKVNDDQYLEFSPGAAETFHLEHVSILTADLKKMGAILETRGLAPGEPARSADGNTYLAIKDSDQIEIRFVRYMPGSQQTEHRGKALGARRVSDHLQHIGLASDNEAASMALYRDKLDFRELFRGGPTPGEIRWINLAAPGTTGDILELMIMASQPAQGRRHIAFECQTSSEPTSSSSIKGCRIGSSRIPGPRRTIVGS
jgi:catechol 2,3-dioxygenase-like lactoylglutathione lyase family enzyme